MSKTGGAVPQASRIAPVIKQAEWHHMLQVAGGHLLLGSFVAA